jgi:hypothetical protein
MGKVTKVVNNDLILVDSTSIVLSEDNIAEHITMVGNAGDRVVELFHHAISFLVTTFGENAVLQFSGNKGKTEDSAKAYAVELGLEYPTYLRLKAIQADIKKRRADSWQQAIACYKRVEAVKNAQAIEAEKADKAVTTAKIVKAEKDLLENQLKIAEVEKAPASKIEKLQAEIVAKEAAYNDAKAKADDAVKALTKERESRKELNEWTTFSEKIESLAKWCKERDKYKDLEPVITGLLKQ